jgi:hypothetical protein
MAYPRRQLCKALSGYRGNNPRRTRKMPDRRAPHRSRRSSSPRAMGKTIAIAGVNYPIAGHPTPSTCRFDSSMSRYRHPMVQPYPRVVQLRRFNSSMSRYHHLTVQPHPRVVQLSRFDSSMSRYHGATPPSGGSIKSVRFAKNRQTMVKRGDVGSSGSRASPIVTIY